MLKSQRNDLVHVKHVLKTSDGDAVIFEGDITQDEHNFIFEVGLITLLEDGALPFQSVADDEDVSNYGSVTSGDKQ